MSLADNADKLFNRSTSPLTPHGALERVAAQRNSYDLEGRLRGFYLRMASGGFMVTRTKFFEILLTIFLRISMATSHSADNAGSAVPQQSQRYSSEKSNIRFKRDREGDGSRKIARLDSSLV